MDPSFRNPPSLTELLESPPLRALVDRVNRNVVVAAARGLLENFRTEIQAAGAEVRVPTPTEFAERVASWILSSESARVHAVINATGILLPQGLGRAPLADAAVQEMVRVSACYADLSRATHRDTSREGTDHVLTDVERLLRELTQAETALVTANYASALWLTLAAIAAPRQVIAARGELGELHEQVRIADLIRGSGALLQEVGSVNAIRRADYQKAFSSDTAALLRTEVTGFEIAGSTESVALSDLVTLAREHAVPLIDNLPMGALLPTTRFGLAHQTTVTQSLRAGTDLVILSGDLLLGGPPCGIILGRRNWVQRIASHPLATITTPGKLTVSALTATLRLYLDESRAEREIPVLSLLTTPLENLRNRAERLAPQLQATRAVTLAQPVEEKAFLTDSRCPRDALPTWAIRITPAVGEVTAFAARLRDEAGMLARVRAQDLLLDLRTVFPRQDTHLVAAFEAIGKGLAT